MADGDNDQGYGGYNDAAANTVGSEPGQGISLGVSAEAPSGSPGPSYGGYGDNAGFGVSASGSGNEANPAVESLFDQPGIDIHTVSMAMGFDPFARDAVGYYGLDMDQAMAAGKAGYQAGISLAAPLGLGTAMMASIVSPIKGMSSYAGAAAATFAGPVGAAIAFAINVETQMIQHGIDPSPVTFGQVVTNIHSYMANIGQNIELSPTAAIYNDGRN